MFKEFRDFAARGNVIDLAVGVIIGAAFGKVVTSAVNDLIMPPIGMALGRVDFSNLFVALERRLVCIARSSQGCGRPDIQLRHLPQYLPRVPHRRVCGVSARQAGQPAQGPRRSSIDTPRLSVLRVEDGAQGDALPRVHIRSQTRCLTVKRARGS